MVESFAVATMTWYSRYGISFITYHREYNTSKTQGATSEAGTAYPSGGAVF